MKKNKILLLSLYFVLSIFSGISAMIPEQNPFNELPDEMIVKIFWHLDFKNLKRIARSDKHFWRIAGDRWVQRQAVRSTDEGLLGNLLASLANHGKENEIQNFLRCVF